MILKTLAELTSAFPELEHLQSANSNHQFNCQGADIWLSTPCDYSEVETLLFTLHPDIKARRLTEKFWQSSITLIDKKFGEGYARKNPNLLGNVVNTHRSMYLTTEDSRR